LKAALDKVAGAVADASVAEFLRPPGAGPGPVAVPGFVRDMSRAFAELQAARQDADYNWNVNFSHTDALLLCRRAAGAISIWQACDNPSERDFKRALGLLMLLKGRLRAD
jgi:hypothetical protein